MKKIYCDKCKERVGASSLKIQLIDIYVTEKHLNDLDLCYNCTNAFINWLKGEPIPKQTQTVKPKLWCPRSSNKTLVLEMLHKAGSDGMSIGEILRCNPEFKRKTISPQLSRWAREGLVVNKNGRHYLTNYV